MTGEFPKTPERKKPEDLELADFQALSAAFVGLHEDKEVPRREIYSRQSTKFDLREWLQGRGVEANDHSAFEEAGLSVPGVYFSPEYIEWMKWLDHINKFPVVDYELIANDVPVNQSPWQRSFLKLHLQAKKYYPEYSAELFVQPRNEVLTFADDKIVKFESSIFLNDRRNPSPMVDEAPRAAECIEALVKYGKELQEA